jgi:hypothetical protein
MSMQTSGTYDASEFVQLVYGDRMRSSDDKMHVIRLFEKVLIHLLPFPCIDNLIVASRPCSRKVL